MVGSLTFLSLNLSFNFMHNFPTYFADPEPEIPELNVKVSRYIIFWSRSAQNTILCHLNISFSSLFSRKIRTRLD